MILIKFPIVINKKKKSRKLNIIAMNNSHNSNNKSKYRPSKFISFLMLINQVVLSDL